MLPKANHFRERRRCDVISLAIGLPWPGRNGAKRMLRAGPFPAPPVPPVAGFLLLATVPACLAPLPALAHSPTRRRPPAPGRTMAHWWLFWATPTLVTSVHRRAFLFIASIPNPLLRHRQPTLPASSLLAPALGAPGKPRRGGAKRWRARWFFAEPFGTPRREWCPPGHPAAGEFKLSPIMGKSYRWRRPKCRAGARPGPPLERCHMLGYTVQMRTCVVVVLGLLSVTAHCQILRIEPTEIRAGESAKLIWRNAGESAFLIGYGKRVSGGRLGRRYAGSQHRLYIGRRDTTTVRLFVSCFWRRAPGTGARVSQPARYRCRRGGVPARLRGFEFLLSSFPNVGRYDTLPVEGRAQTTC